MAGSKLLVSLAFADYFWIHESYCSCWDLGFDFVNSLYTFSIFIGDFQYFSCKLASFFFNVTSVNVLLWSDFQLCI